MLPKLGLPPFRCEVKHSHLAPRGKYIKHSTTKGKFTATFTIVRNQQKGRLHCLRSVKIYAVIFRSFPFTLKRVAACRLTFNALQSVSAKTRKKKMKKITTHTTMTTQRGISIYACISFSDKEKFIDFLRVNFTTCSASSYLNYL